MAEPRHSCRSPVELLTVYFSLPVVLIALSCSGDRPISSMVQKHLYDNPAWSQMTGSLPDSLSVIVGLVTVGSYATYRVLRWAASRPGLILLFRSLAVLAPFTFAAKTLLKYIFGRVETRVWLHDPALYGFHWFQGGNSDFNGFPSGHMMVFTALFAAIGRAAPASRPLLGCLLVILGLLLVATNYHFLSDVLSGAYFGILIERSLHMVMGRADSCPVWPAA